MFSRTSLIVMLLCAGFGVAACDASGYRKSSGGWMHGDFKLTPRDAATFKPLDDVFARDALRGYCRGSEVADSGGASLAVVSEREAHDENNVYFCDTAYVRDRANGYHGHRDVDSLHEPHLPPPDVLRKLDGAEPAAIRVLGLGYAADTRHVWHRGRPLAGADASTFAVDESHQGDADATDKSGAWQHGKRVVASK